MNLDDVFNAANTNGISPEKLAFLKAMSARQSGNNAKDMMAALMSASKISPPKRGGFFFFSAPPLLEKT